jgi:hypothetical protein
MPSLSLFAGVPHISPRSTSSKGRRMVEILLHPAVTTALVADTREFKKLALKLWDEADLEIRQIAIQVPSHSWDQALTTCQIMRACIVNFDPLSPEAARHLDAIKNFFAAVEKFSAVLRRIFTEKSGQTAA